MSTFKEFILSFLEASRERLKNPFVGSFVLSWLAINWRISAILFFSELSIENRIKLIEECYLTLNLTLWYPLLITGIYLLIIPNLMALIDALLRWAINLRKSIANEYKLKDIQAKQEIAVEERQLELIEEGSPDIHKLKEKIEQLEKEKEILLSKQSAESEESTISNSESENNEEKQESSNTNTRRKKPTSKKTIQPTKDASTPLPTSKEHPSMRENVIRNIAKSEKEWILLYGFYASNFGKKEFGRKDIISAYEETKRKTTGRMNNLTNNINNLVKQGLLRFLNDEDMLLTDAGTTLANEILNR